MSTERILVIDDDPGLRTYLEAALDREGWTLESAATGEQGLALAVDNPYDVILLDFMLPDIDGLEVLEELRAHGIQTPVVALTGKGNEAVATRFLSEGAVDFLPKTDLSRPRLVRSLENALWVSGPNTEPVLVGEPAEPSFVQVLVVSRHGWLERFVREQLGEGAWSVKTQIATSYEQATEASRNQWPDLIIVDARNVEEAAGIIEMLGDRTSAPSIAVLSRASDEEAARLLDAGADDFLLSDDLTPLRLTHTVRLLLGYR